jgi:Gpi18-like mannosyltransferase
VPAVDHQDWTSDAAAVVRPNPSAGCRPWIAGLGVALLALLVRWPLLSEPGFIFDQTQFLVWSSMTRSAGLDVPYALRPDGSGKYWCNYPPGYVYVLRLLAAVYGHVSDRELDGSTIEGFMARDASPATRAAARLYKLPAVAADAALGLLLVLWLSGRIGLAWAVTVSSLYVLTPAVIHNSAVWGQIDAIPAVLVVASLEAARRRTVLWMSAFASLAMLTKPQTATMAPVWIAAAYCWAGWNWRRWAQAVGLIAALTVIMLLPFCRVLGGVWQAYAGAARYYPFTHLNGFSLWFLGNPLLEPHLGDLSGGRAWPEPLQYWYLSDRQPWLLGISPRSWGFVAVGLVGLYTLAVLWRRRSDDRSLMWAARLLPLGFFVLSTQMHERYLFPAIAVWAWSAAPTRRWLGGWLVVALCATVNVLWSWAGPPEAPWVPSCDRLLHQTWLTAAPGVWCSLTLGVVFLATLLGWVDHLWRREPSLMPRIEKEVREGT